jgi:hypothetical protein
MVYVKKPKIINELLNKKDFFDLQTYIKSLDKSTLKYDEEINRFEFGNHDYLNNIQNSLLPIAKKFFQSDTLLPSYTFGSWYVKGATLDRHKDIAPCTYTIDLCVYQKTPWNLYVEGSPYTLHENDAVLYYGEDQVHWREDFPDPENNEVCNIFFFYVEPDHWFFTEPEENHQSIRRQNHIQRNVRENV